MERRISLFRYTSNGKYNAFHDGWHPTHTQHPHSFHLNVLSLDIKVWELTEGVSSLEFETGPYSDQHEG
jgi:hypothetical protein